MNYWQNSFASRDQIAGTDSLQEDLTQIILENTNRFFAKDYQSLNTYQPLTLVNRLLEAGMPHNFLNQIPSAQLGDVLNDLM